MLTRCLPFRLLMLPVLAQFYRLGLTWKLDLNVQQPDGQNRV